MVVKKRDVSSFRDVELAAVFQEYRTFMGWKTQDTTRKVGTGVTHCLLLGLSQWAWETWTYLLRSDYWHKAKRNKKYEIIKTIKALLWLLYHAKGLVHASLCKAKRSILCNLPEPTTL